MSETDKHSIIGALVSDRQRAKEEQALLGSKIRRYGAAMWDGAEQIKKGAFDDALRVIAGTPGGGFPDSTGIADLLREYLGLNEKIKGYNSQLDTLGINRG